MRTGLRTEITISISLLLTAALLFAGFLLLKLTESNLLDQQRTHAASVVRLLVAGLDGQSQSQRFERNSFSMLRNLERLHDLMSEQQDILAWRLLDAELQVVSSTNLGTEESFPLISASMFARGELHEDIVYDSFHFLGGSESQSYIELSSPLWAENETYGLLQVRFDLTSLQERIWASQKLVLIYVFVYGLILAAFALYLLNRNVVKPVRQLHQATTQVAGGELTSATISSGPGEIHDLAESFNQMVEALANSRAETEEHIESLEEANHALARARDDLVRSEKLATVGHLAAGMAHEIGNPLGALIGYLNLLKDDLHDDAKDLLERSLSETSRIDRLIRELLDYSTPAAQQEESFCPVTLLRETIEMLRHQGQLGDVEILDDCQVDECLVKMDRGRLMQVWINLLLNAQDAMLGEGKINLASQRSGDSLTVWIGDDGPGIDEDSLGRVFEPFYTTKAPGSGYGLGLAVCQRIIDESGGQIKVKSNEGQGACFSVTLPYT
jgi:signal transduction histidine kinase